MTSMTVVGTVVVGAGWVVVTTGGTVDTVVDAAVVGSSGVGRLASGVCSG
jgi:hypothetical protein